MVSHKRSLHRQSGRAYAHDIEENVVQWERVWVSPLSIPSSATSNAPNGKATPGSSSTSAQKINSNINSDGSDKPPTFSFKVKVWAQLNNQAESIAIKDGDDDDYINLVAATQSRKGAPVPAGSGSLTAADIRGAVGGGEDVSISSYTSNEAKPKEDKPVEGGSRIEVISEELQTDAATDATETPQTIKAPEQQASETEAKEPVSTSESVASADKESEEPPKQDASTPATEEKEITEEPKQTNDEEAVATITTDEPSTTEQKEPEASAPAAAESEESKPAEAATVVEEEKSESKPASETVAEAVLAEDVEIKDAPAAESVEDDKKPEDASKPEELVEEAVAITETTVIAAEPDVEMKDASAEAATEDVAAAKLDETADVEMKDS